MVACWYWWKDCVRRGRRRDGCLLVLLKGLCKERRRRDGCLLVLVEGLYKERKKEK